MEDANITTKSKKLGHQILGETLAKAKKVSNKEVIRSADIDRATRERLTQAGYLEEVVRGWYLLTNPVGKGTSTLWFSNYWEFIKQYLSNRFGEDGYCLSPESSLNIFAGQSVVSKQIIVLTKKTSNQTLELPHDTSVLLYTDAKNFPEVIHKHEGLNIFPLPEAICKVSPRFFAEHSLNAEICLKLIGSTAELSRVILANNFVAAAERISGAYQQLGEPKRAQQIIDDMAAAGRQITPINPFESAELCLRGVERLTSPYSGRIEALWGKMRSDVLANFPVEPDHADKTLLTIMDQLYKEDTYHSLSIEGYQVTPDLIDRIKNGDWSPEQIQTDSEQKNALAARGYLNAFKAVGESAKKVILDKTDAAQVLSDDLQGWYRHLFTPLAQAQLVKAEDLAGYRSGQVHISGSRHVPPPVSALLDCMETLEKLLKKEESAAVRAILGHFVFVYIHPYMDGNGRIGRFIMNLMLISGGYNWTVIRASERMRYISALEEASTKYNIVPFCKFVASEMDHWKSLKYPCF